MISVVCLVDDDVVVVYVDVAGFVTFVELIAC